MNGKTAISSIVLSAAVAGFGIYYMQVYAYYEPVEQAEVELVSIVSDRPEPIRIDNFEGIDADSSPIRYRACFVTDMSLDTLSATYVGLAEAAPRIAPGWFDCFDAAAIGAELEAGTAQAFLGRKNVEFGVDRIVAVTEDGRGYVWHELNNCGEKAYDGTIVGEDCPERE